jgi:hypothetical protein
MTTPKKVGALTDQMERGKDGAELEMKKNKLKTLTWPADNRLEVSVRELNCQWWL